MNKKVIKIVLLLCFIFFGAMYFGSRGVDGYLFVENNRGETDIFAREKITRTLLDKDLKKVEIEPKRYMNGEIYMGLPNGNYYLKSKLETHNEEMLTTIKKDEDYKRIKVNYRVCDYINMDRKILGFSSIIIIILNLSFFYVLRDRIKTIPGYVGIFYLLLVKMVIGNNLISPGKMVHYYNAVLSSGIGIGMIYYYFRNKRVKLNLFFLSLIIFYGVIDFIFLVMMSSGKIYSFMYMNGIFMEKWMTLVYRYIDFPFILFSMLLFRSLKEKVSPILLINKRKKESIIIIYLVLSLVAGLMAHRTRLYGYVNMYNYMFAYWLTVFFQIKSFTKNLNYVLRIFIHILTFYIFFYFTNNIYLIGIFVGAFAVTNLISYLFVGIVRTDFKYIEEVENRFVLVDDLQEFKYQLKKELEKSLILKKVKIIIFFEKFGYKNYLKDSNKIENLTILSKEYILDSEEYDSAGKLSYGKTKFLGLILLENKRGRLLYEEEKYLIELSKIASKVASRIRLSKLQEDLKCIK